LSKKNTIVLLTSATPNSLAPSPNPS